MEGAIQTLFRDHADAYVREHASELGGQRRKAIAAICSCGSPEAGVLMFSCEQCSQMHSIERSCGNRMCPACQAAKTEKWLHARLERQLPVHYFLLTFTVPEQLRPFMMSRPEAAFNAFFKAVSGAIRTLAANPRHIGVDLPGVSCAIWPPTCSVRPSPTTA